MRKLSWNISLNNESFLIELHHKYFTGNKTLFINGVEAYKSSSFFDLNNEVTLDIKNKKIRASVEPYGTDFQYKLYIENQPLEVNEEKELPLPYWSLLFFLILSIIPIISYEGIIGLTIAVIGIAKCYKTIKIKNLNNNSKIKRCFLITIFSYLIFIIYYNLVNIIFNFFAGKLF